MVETGALLELDVERVAHGGVFVAHHEGRVVFVSDTAPGERVLARVSDDRHERFLRAETVEVLRPAPERRPHVWGSASVERPPGERAGGAEFGHLAPEAQRALKAAVLADALVRTGGLSPHEVAGLGAEVRAVDGPADGTRSRTRVRLHVDASGRVGPYAARTREVVPVPDLPLAVEAAERVAPLAGTDPAVRAVEVVAPSAGPAFALPAGEPHPPIEERIGDRVFALEADGFWQVHPAAAAVLTDAVRRAVDLEALDPGDEHLDLYGGVGLLAAALADVAGPRARIITVEADRAASRHAAANLADLPRARAVALRVDRFLATPSRASAAAASAPRASIPRASAPRPSAPRASGARAGVVVLDPPRSGAGHRVVDLIAGRDPRQVVYVACDPVALARDVARFRVHGFAATRMEAFDLFPNTHHLEAVAVLRRA